MGINITYVFVFLGMLDCSRTHALEKLGWRELTCRQKIKSCFRHRTPLLTTSSQYSIPYMVSLTSSESLGCRHENWSSHLHLQRIHGDVQCWSPRFRYMPVKENQALNFRFHFSDRRSNKYRATIGLGTKCTIWKQRVLKSFPAVIRRQRKVGKLAAIGSWKHYRSKSGLIFAVRRLCVKWAHFFFKRPLFHAFSVCFWVACWKSAHVWRRIVVQQIRWQIWKVCLFCFILLPMPPFSLLPHDLERFRYTLFRNSAFCS